MLAKLERRAVCGEVVRLALGCLAAVVIALLLIRCGYYVSLAPGCLQNPVQP
jgi:hypothetical protein